MFQRAGFSDGEEEVEEGGGGVGNAKIRPSRVVKVKNLTLGASSDIFEEQTAGRVKVGERGGERGETKEERNGERKN